MYYPLENMRSGFALTLYNLAKTELVLYRNGPNFGQKLNLKMNIVGFIQLEF